MAESRFSPARFALAGLLLVTLTCTPAAMAADRPTALPAVGSNERLSFMSETVSIHKWARDPSSAPTRELRQHFRALDRARVALRAAPASAAGAADAQAILSNIALTGDSHGLPQNEESVTTCLNDGTKVLGGTNDFRGLLFPGFTGWHYSSTGGISLSKEGGLPALAGGVPSQGDPVAASNAACTLYMSSLNFNDTATQVGLYRTTPAALAAAACAPNANGATRADADCWPTRKAVMKGLSKNVFYDKQWTDAGASGGAGNVVWTAATRFSGNPGSSQIKAVRCNGTLATCTNEILISDPGDSNFATGNKFTQFSHVEIGDSGRTYISWVVVTIDPKTGAETFTIKVKSAAPGSTVFGPSKVVATLANAVPLDGVLPADNFRVTTVPQMTSKRITPTIERVYVSYETCQQIKFGNLCYGPQTKLSRFNVNPTTGATGAVATTLVSLPGDASNYMTSVNADPLQGKLAMVYYTNRVDPFDHRQAVELATLDLNGAVTQRQLISDVNEPNADPFLGGSFIGDYIEVAPRNGVALTHYNANFLKKVFLPTISPAGPPVNQQDNFLNRSSY
jgi:hypothetical protein